MSRGSGIPTRSVKNLKRKNKLDFCLEELTIKLRKANINKCGNLKISPRNILLHTEQFNPDLNATEIIAKGLVRMGKR